jgi:sporulation-control protein
VFKRMKAAFGGGAEVDTVLTVADAQPGGTLQGNVNVKGGTVDLDINFIEVRLEAKVEVEYETSDGGDGEYMQWQKFGGIRVTDRFELKEGQQHSIPFQLQVPWESPFNVIQGQQLKIQLGARTELDIARSVDKGDLDPIRIHPLPAQERILTAFNNIGFRFKDSDCEKDRIPGSPLSFRQELEFYPAPQFQGRLNELEVVFLAGPSGMDVLLEMDKRGGFLRAGGDSMNRFSVGYDQLHMDWENQLNDHLGRLLQSGGGFFG